MGASKKKTGTKRLYIPPVEESRWFAGGEWEWRFVRAPYGEGGYYPTGGSYCYVPRSIKGRLSYDPSEKQAVLMASVLEVGRETFLANGGELVSKFGWPKAPRGETTFPQGLPQLIERFHAQFGPLLKVPEWSTDPSRFKAGYLWRRSAHGFLQTAQLVFVINQYAAFVSGRKKADGGVTLADFRPLIKAVFKQLLIDEPSADWDEYVKEDALSTKKGVTEASARLLEDVQYWPDGPGGVRTRYAPVDKGGKTGWTNLQTFEHLSNLVYFWAFENLKNSAPYARCPNHPRCPQPGAMFQRVRKDQEYCSVKCRSAAGSRRVRRNQSSTKGGR